MVPTTVIAQAWRDGTKQARLERAIGHCQELPLTGDVARACGGLCGAAGTNDVVDASVAVAAATMARATRTTVVTSDPGDIRRLLDELGSAAIVERV